MTTTLSPELKQLIRQEMARGWYASENDLLMAAVQLLSERREQLDALRREIQPALDRLDRGEGTPLNIEAIKAKARRLASESADQHDLLLART
jgi:antitoxin ParD1/3/4